MFNDILYYLDKLFGDHPEIHKKMEAELTSSQKQLGQTEASLLSIPRPNLSDMIDLICLDINAITNKDELLNITRNLFSTDTPLVKLKQLFDIGTIDQEQATQHLTKYVEKAITFIKNKQGQEITSDRVLQTLILILQKKIIEDTYHFDQNSQSKKNQINKDHENRICEAKKLLARFHLPPLFLENHTDLLSDLQKNNCAQLFLKSNLLEDTYFSAMTEKELQNCLTELSLMKKRGTFWFAAKMYKGDIAARTKHFIENIAHNDIRIEAKEALDENFPDALTFLERIGKITPSDALLLAAENGHTNAVSRWINYPNINLEESNTHGETPLLLAAKNGHTDIVTTLLEHKANALASSSDGRNALMFAAENGHAAVVNQLINHEHKYSLNHELYDFINAVNREYYEDDLDAIAQPLEVTALMYAAQKGHADVVKILLDNNANPILTDANHNTALLLTLMTNANDLSDQEKNNRLAIVKYLIEAENSTNEAILNYDINFFHDIASNQNGESALFLAAKHGYDSIVEYLLQQPHAINYLYKTTDEDSTPLLIAIENGHENIINKILEKDPSLLDFRVDNRLPPIIEAIYHAQFAVIKLLLDKGATLPDNEWQACLVKIEQIELENRRNPDPEVDDLICIYENIKNLIQEYQNQNTDSRHREPEEQDNLSQEALLLMQLSQYPQFVDEKYWDDEPGEESQSTFDESSPLLYSPFIFKRNSLFSDEDSDSDPESRPEKRRRSDNR